MLLFPMNQQLVRISGTQKSRFPSLDQTIKCLKDSDILYMLLTSVRRSVRFLHFANSEAWPFMESSSATLEHRSAMVGGLCQAAWHTFEPKSFSVK